MAKKKVAAKKRTAKKKVSMRAADTVQPPLDPEWDPNALPEDLADKVDVYLKNMRAKNKLTEKTRNSKEAAIECMKAHGLNKIRIDEGRQWLIVEDKPTLKTKKVNLEKDDTRQAVTA